MTMRLECWLSTISGLLHTYQSIVSPYIHNSRHYKEHKVVVQVNKLFLFAVWCLQPTYRSRCNLQPPCWCIARPELLPSYSYLYWDFVCLVWSSASLSWIELRGLTWPVKTTLLSGLQSSTYSNNPTEVLNNIETHKMALVICQQCSS